MKRFVAALALALGLALPMAASDFTYRSTHLAYEFDLDGEAADDDQVVAVATFADSTTFTIAAQPDACRLLDITVVDADSSITAGVLTVTGTDCWGDTLVATFTAAAGGSGVKSLVVDNASYRPSGAYFKTVTSVISGVLTGEGGAGDTLKVGYAGDGTPAQTPLLGVRIDSRSDRSRTVNPFDSYIVTQKITTSGAYSTTVTSVNSDSPFDNVAVGDVIIVNNAGVMDFRKITARASANSVTVDRPIKIASTGIGLRYQKYYVIADPIDGWIGVEGNDAIAWTFDVALNANTGGVISDVRCSSMPGSTADVQVDTDTVASAATGTAVTSVDLRLVPQYRFCKFSMEFGTGDDTDTAAEIISVAYGTRR